MLKRVMWKENAVLSVKLRDDLFTLAQMRKNHLMEFFDIKSTNSEWGKINLSSIDPIFCIYVAEGKLKSILEKTLDSDMVEPNKRDIQRKMLDIDVLPPDESGLKFCINLVELDDTFESLNAKVIKRKLELKNDRDLITGLESTGMQGSPDKLKNRLIRYFEGKSKLDDQIIFIFPELKNT